MKVLNDIIEKCEKVYKKKNNYFSVIALISRLYFRFLETGFFGYADNAFFIAVKSFKNSTQNIMYILMAAFFEMETGRHRAAYKRISVCEGYKSYLKSNRPEIYAFYLYINSMLFLKQKETRNSLKIYREIVNIWEQNNNLYSVLLILAALDIEYDNFGSAKKDLNIIWKKIVGIIYFMYVFLNILAAKTKAFIVLQSYYILF